MEFGIADTYTETFVDVFEFIVKLLYELIILSCYNVHTILALGYHHSFVLLSFGGKKHITCNIFAL